MWAALQQQFGVQLTDGKRSCLAPGACARFVGISLGGDGCETNIKLWKHAVCQTIAQHVADDCEPCEPLAIATPCVQHAIALVKAPLGRILDVNVPVFCVAKQFTQSSHSKVAEEAAYEFIDVRLRWIQARVF